MHKKYWVCLLVLSCLITCVRCSKDKRVFDRVTSDQSGITFINKLVENDTFNILQNEYVYNGGGVAVGDLDNDGLPELFFTGNQVSCALYYNNGALKFTDITKDAGLVTNRWATGAVFADVNSDGWLDIYVSCAGYPDSAKRTNYLFINQQNLTFREAAAEFGLDDTGYSTQAAFLDYDQDGDLDMYLLTHANKDRDYNYIRPQTRDGSGASTDKLFRNDCGKFTNVSDSAGITIEGYGLGIVVADFNRDAWLDIYVANDYVYNDILYINQQDGTFKDELKQRVSHTSQFSMGVDAGDINNDGYADIIVADMLPPDNVREKTLTGPMGYDKFMMTLEQGYVPQYMRNTLQLNTDGNSFYETGQLAGIESTDWSWAPLLADFDDDGYDDLFITTGYYKNVTDRDFTLFTGGLMYDAIAKKKFKDNRLLKAVDSIGGTPLINRVFRNNRDLTFSDQSEEWGLNEPSFSHGAVYSDLDRDGDLDIVVNNLNAEAELYENKTEPLDRQFIAFELSGQDLNTFGIGSAVELTLESGKIIRKENNPVRGYQSCVEPVLHFTWPVDDQMKTVTIMWSNGMVSELTDFKVNSFNKIAYKNFQKKPYTQPIVKKSLQASSKSIGVAYKHVSSTYVDFKTEPLLPYRFSQRAPALAIGDVNNDGLDDFYVGGSDRVAGKLYIHIKSGSFFEVQLPKLLLSDETDALFFDADGDSDLDLYVTAGGNEYYPRAANYVDKFFRNDGDGRFTWQPDIIPSIASSKSCVAANDFDGDGDLDLFLGGMVEPWRYPLPPDSYILRNDEGKFIDITNDVCPELKRFALVKQAAWADINNDGRADLIVAAEYKPVTVFVQLENGKFENSTEQLGLNRHVGWWQSVLPMDVDQDGDIDIISGNIGLNNKLRASPDKPVTLVANDFDKNNSLDAITARYFSDGLHPLASRDMLFDQVPGFRKRFLYHKEYGKADLNDVINIGLDRCLVLEATEMRSGVFVNQHGKFEFMPFPSKGQIMPVQQIVYRNETLYLSGGDIECDTNQGNLGVAGVICIPDFEYKNFQNSDFKTIRLHAKTRKTGHLKGRSKTIMIIPIKNDSILFVSENNLN